VFQIKKNFEINPDAVEVLIFEGKQTFVVKRSYATKKAFAQLFSLDNGK